MFLHQKINVLFIKNSNLSEILCLNNYCPLECDSLTCYIIKDLTTIMGQGRLLISVNHQLLLLILILMRIYLKHFLELGFIVKT